MRCELVTSEQRAKWVGANLRKHMLMQLSHTIDGRTRRIAKEYE